MKSWKTTLGGVGMILSALANIVNRWKSTGTLSFTAEDMIAITGGFGLLSARDNNVTSEQAGAHTNKP